MAKGIFGKKTAATYSKIDELISIANSKGLGEDSYVVMYLNKVKETDLISSFKTEDVLYNVIRLVLNLKINNASLTIGMAKSIFDVIVYDPTDNDELYLFYKYLDEIFSNDDAFEYFNQNIEDFKTINSLFNANYKFAFSFFEYFCDNIISNRNDARTVIKYAKEARRYYVDDAAFNSSLISFAEHSLDMHGKDLEKYKEECLERDQRDAGDYKFSEEAIVENTRKLEKAQRGVEEINAQTADLSQRISNMSDEVEVKIDDLIDKKTGEIDEAIEMAKRELKTNIEVATGALTTRQKEFNSILDEREKRFKVMLESIIESGEHYKAEISKRLEAHPELEKSVIFSGSSILDPKIPSKERYKRALALKNPNEIYHEKFDLILKYMIMHIPVMLVGPSGAGKTFTTNQLGALIGSSVYNFGYVADEYTTIRGYNDSNGNYVKTPFYDVFKYGGLAFFDEVDNSESKALIELNKIISGNGYERYLFPNGDRITPNYGFNIITGANTMGDGADPDYPTREILDRSTLNRFAIIPYGFDPNVESKIMANYKKEYEFCLAFRNVLLEKHKKDLVSTKDMEFIKYAIEEGLLTWDEIISKTFIKNRTKTELTQIKELLTEKVNTRSEIYSEFSKSVEGMSL